MMVRTQPCLTPSTLYSIFRTIIQFCSQCSPRQHSKIIQSARKQFIVDTRSKSRLLRSLVLQQMALDPSKKNMSENLAQYDQHTRQVAVSMSPYLLPERDDHRSGGRVRWEPGQHTSPASQVHHQSLVGQQGYYICPLLCHPSALRSPP